MKLVVNKDMKNNTYKVDLHVLDITDTDKEKFSDFGEPVVDVGGVIKGAGIEQKYVPVQEPVTEKQTVTVTEKQTVQEEQLVFEEDGTTPVYEEDGVTQKTELVDVEKDVEVQKEIDVPVLDANGLPVTKDKVNENGEKVYQLVETPIETVLADLGKCLRKFPSDFPISRSFSVAEFGNNAENIAHKYVEQVRDVLETVIEDLKIKEDTFSGKEEIQL